MRKMVGHAPILICGASVIVVNKSCELLLQKRRDNGCWGYHGGCIELDKVAEEAAKRELFEETGLNAISLELFGVFSGPDMHYVYPNGDEVSSATFTRDAEFSSDYYAPSKAKRFPLSLIVKARKRGREKKSANASIKIAAYPSPYHRYFRRLGEHD